MWYELQTYSQQKSKIGDKEVLLFLLLLFLWSLISIQSFNAQNSIMLISSALFFLQKESIKFLQINFKLISVRNLQFFFRKNFFPEVLFITPSERIRPLLPINFEWRKKINSFMVENSPPWAYMNNSGIQKTNLARILAVKICWYH